VKQQLTSSPMVETFKDAPPDHENTCKLIYFSMKQLTEKIMLNTTSEAQREMLGAIYESKLNEYKKMDCTCHKELNKTWL
jgi:hypothetical protein